MSKPVLWFRWRSFLAYGGAFFLTGLGWLLFKHLQLTHLTGLKLLARVLHREDGDFSAWEVLALYGSDVGWGLLLIPMLAGLLAAQRRLPDLRPLLVLMLLAYVMLLHADMAAFANVSTLLSWDMIGEALAWARTDPDVIQYYVTPRTWLKILASTVGLLLMLLWLDRGSWRWPQRLDKTSTVWAGLALALGMSMAVLLALLQPVSAYPQSSAALAQALMAMAPDLQAGQYRGHSQAQLQQAFCKEVGAPCPGKTSPPPPAVPPGESRDVILFIMETAPADFFDLAALLAEDPLLREWSRRSWLAQRHYATYPYTSDATFSMLAALYPEGRRQWQKCRESQPIGWVNDLRRVGYEARHYAPSPDSFEADRLMLERLGLRDRYIAEEEGAGRPRAQARLEQLWRRVFPDSGSAVPPKAVLDQQGLDRLLADIEGWHRLSRPYVAVFSPQIGHAPWQDLLQRPEPPSLQERALALGRLQMAWLHEIVAQLKRAARLERTLLLVTGDHGLRTRTEYAQLPAGWLAGVSSHVPLLIYDGGRALPFDPGQLSSHIDIGPTVLERLGVSSGQAYVEGLSLTAPERGQRRTYMQGVGYLGAELMHGEGRFLAHAPLRKACLSATRDGLDDGEVQPYARCSEAFEPLKALHLEAMRRLCLH